MHPEPFIFQQKPILAILNRNQPSTPSKVSFQNKVFLTENCVPILEPVLYLYPTSCFINFVPIYNKLSG
jgi:hypothetical protein